VAVAVFDSSDGGAVVGEGEEGVASRAAALVADQAHALDGPRLLPGPCQGVPRTCSKEAAHVQQRCHRRVPQRKKQLFDSSGTSRSISSTVRAPQEATLRLFEHLKKHLFDPSSSSARSASLTNLRHRAQPSNPLRPDPRPHSPLPLPPRRNHPVPHTPSGPATRPAHTAVPCSQSDLPP
jgi:hypothetical protein